MRARKPARPCRRRRRDRSLRGRHSRAPEADVLRDLAGDLAEVALEHRRGAGQGAWIHLRDSACSVVLVEESLQPLNDRRVILDEGARAVQPLFLAAPVSNENRAAWRGIDRSKNAHRLHHGHRSGAVVGRPSRRRPRIEVRRQDHVLVRLLASADFGNGVEDGTLAAHLGRRVDPEPRRLPPLGEARQQAVVLARHVEGQHAKSRRPRPCRCQDIRKPC